MPHLPNDGRKGCITFEERVYKLIATNQLKSEEFQTWKSIFGREKLEAIYKKFKAGKMTIPSLQEEGPPKPDEDGWVLIQPDEMRYVNKDEIEEYGSTLPGGAIYLRLKIYAVQETHR